MNALHYAVLYLAVTLIAVAVIKPMALEVRASIEKINQSMEQIKH